MLFKTSTNKYLAIIGILVIVIPIQLIARLTLAFIDTTGRDIAPYHHFLEQAKQAEFETYYYGIDYIVDSPDLILDQDLVLFMCDYELLTAKQANPVRKTILKLYRQRLNYRSPQNKQITGLALPTTESQKMLKTAKRMLQKLDLTRTDQNQINFFLRNSSCRKKISYNTTLRQPSMSVPQQEYNKYQNFIELPVLSEKASDEIKIYLPYALYKVDQSGRPIVIMPNWILTATGIAENFLVVPVSQKLRAELDNLTQQTLVQLKNLLTNQPLATKSQNMSENLVTSEITPSEPLQSKTTIAWMELTAFVPSNLTDTAEIKNQKIIQQQQLINYILTARLDRLWLGLSPQMYIGKTARYPNKKSEFYQTIRDFYTQLQTAAQTQSVKIPKLYLGFEIANNLYPPYLPEQYAVDLFGNVYQDVPAPLNLKFWQDEILEPLDTLTHDLPEIPWAGIAIDFEMYKRKQISQFSDLMGFDQKTWRQLQPSLPQTKTMQTYYTQLSYQAEQLGVAIKVACKKSIPNCQISCYSPNIVTNWFYEGMLRGLSSDQEPIYLMTFNTEYLAHKWWFKEHKINAKHVSVLMLSKFALPQDFDLFEQALRNHDGVWFNRWSRLVEKFQPNDWTTVENTPLPEADKLNLMQHIGRN